MIAPDSVEDFMRREDAGGAWSNWQPSGAQFWQPGWKRFLRNRS